MGTSTVPLAAPTPTEVLERAEQRLSGMVARNAPHDLVLHATAAYERMYASAVALQQARHARDAAVAAAGADLPAALLAGRRADHERHNGGAL